MSDQIEKDLKSVVRGEVSGDPEIISDHARDASIFNRTPRLVVFPHNTEDIQRLVNYVNIANQDGKGLHLTPRARGTDMTGGPLSDSIVVNVDRHLNDIDVVNKNELYADVAPGVEFTAFEQEVLPTHLTMPVYPSSKHYAAFGGMIGNDCAGEKTLRYGKMHDFVIWNEVVLHDGSVARFGRVGWEVVQQKMATDTAEGSIYRQLVPLLQRHHTLIKAHHPPVSKNSSGYGLWRVWNELDDTWDLGQLITGSQGTLGIITKSRIRLIHDHPHRTLVTVFIRDWQELPRIINAVLPFVPEMLEAYDDTTLAVAMQYRRQLAALHHISNFKMWRLLAKERVYKKRHQQLPPLTLLIELAEAEVIPLNNKIAGLQQVLLKDQLDFNVVSDRDEYHKFWAIRRESYKLLKDHTPGATATVFIEDFCVSPTQLPSFFPKVLQILHRHNIRATIAGHAGNGNFHIIPLMDLSLASERAKILPVMDEVHQLIWDHGGSISGEHNDGILRTPFVENQFGTDMYKLFREVKRIFDPNNIFNPGKKIGGTIDDITQSMITDNPVQKIKGIYA